MTVGELIRCLVDYPEDTPVLDQHGEEVFGVSEFYDKDDTGEVYVAGITL